MEVLIEYTLTAFIVSLLIVLVLYAYYKTKKTETKVTSLKIDKAKEYGFHEPVSLHPLLIRIFALEAERVLLLARKKIFWVL